jgi:hypothetical protein
MQMHSTTDQRSRVRPAARRPYSGPRVIRLRGDARQRTLGTASRKYIDAKTNYYQ